jgi:hypothetical protein
MREEKRNDGLLVAVAGGTRCGKSYWTMEQIRSASRALVWDPRGEYTAAGCELIQDLPTLAAKLKETWDGEGKFCYWGPLADFQEWATMAYLWGQLWPAALVAEELADVTNSGGGKGAWGELVRKGLFYGNHVYGITQRPQEVDKTLWGNAMVKHCHRLELPLDSKYMGQVMGCEPEDVAGLVGYQWIERHAGDPAGHVRKGGKAEK